MDKKNENFNYYEHEDIKKYVTKNHNPKYHETRNKKSSVKCDNPKCDVALCIDDCGMEPNYWAQFQK
jgi:hypothetical protein